jgi:CBS domain-containing protein
MGPSKEIEMNAKDIMTRKVTTVTPGTLVKRVAALLVERRISAVPVVENGRLAGIVSEGDLLHRYEIGTDCARSADPWWVTLFSAERSPGEYVKSHARYARDIMTREVAAVAPDTPLAEIASLLEKRRIKRVPVLQEGRIVGIVSRSDLVRALASGPASEGKAGAISDEAILGRLQAELQRQAWWRADFSNITVKEGVVTYSGLIDLESGRMAARVAAETVPGVRAVVDRRMAYQQMPSML